MSVPGGLTVNFNSANYNFTGAVTNGGAVNFGTPNSSCGVTGTSNYTFNFWGAVTNNGSCMSFGSGTFNLAGGLATSSSSTTTFGAGTFNSWGPVTNNGSQLTFGNGTFYLAQGLTNSSTTSFGAGTFNIQGPVTNSGSQLTFGDGTFNLAQGLTTGGSSTTSFGAGTFNFGKTVTNQGSSLSFGAGTFTLAGGLTTGGGSTTSFGAGTFNIGPAPAASPCPGASYSICNLSTLTFGGPSTFVLTSGVYNAGGETILFGSGSTNSYQIGKSGDGNALNVGGGATTTFADATGATDLFQMVGNLTESGGSCITLPAANSHDINGTVSLMGGLTLGSGLYAVSGSFLIGASSGGDVWCAGQNVGVTGANVTIAIAASGAQTGSNAFVIGSGFSHVTLSAPTSGTYKNVTIVGPLSSTVTNGMLLDEGASATTVGGTIYFPNGPMTMSGGASVANGANQCLEFVASQITLSGGTSMTASPCFPAGTNREMSILRE